MDIRNILSLTGVTLLIGAAGWYWGMGSPTASTHADVRRPDYVITGITALETDQNGQINKRLTAQSLQHFDQPQDETLLAYPSLTIYNNGQAAWQVSAQAGRGLNFNTEFHLEKNVVANRLLTDASPLTLTTSFMQIYPKEERLLTPQLVTVKTPYAELNSLGIEANLKAGTLALTHQIQGYYESPHR